MYIYIYLYISTYHNLFLFFHNCYVFISNASNYQGIAAFRSVCILRFPYEEQGGMDLRSYCGYRDYRYYRDLQEGGYRRMTLSKPSYVQ